ncbi:hypothetical protein QJS10_CPA09g01376 [Acorus calamus]|uniref:Uncharacterized protein n=1 Tax=Acorus calamus TaxID=4465 RepID=A0AAV9E3C4_ACOCL|nr:hypothetical protein QJS10_CPA09g01376 [Acorus calamus]
MEKARARKASSDQTGINDDEIDRPIATSDRPPSSDPEIIESNCPMQEVPLLPRFMKITQIERRRLQMEEERKKKNTEITESDRARPPFLQRTPIFRGGGLEIFNRPGGGLEVFTIPGERGPGVWIVPYDCPCHQLQVF